MDWTWRHWPPTLMKRAQHRNAIIGWEFALNTRVHHSIVLHQRWRSVTLCAIHIYLKPLGQCGAESQMEDDGRLTTHKLNGKKGVAYKQPKLTLYVGPRLANVQLLFWWATVDKWRCSDVVFFHRVTSSMLGHQSWPPPPKKRGENEKNIGISVVHLVTDW